MAPRVWPALQRSRATLLPPKPYPCDLAMTRRNCTPHEEPKGDTYRRLLVSSLEYCNVFLLVDRGYPEFDESAKGLLERLQPFLIGRTEESEWPGTKLLNSTATVHRFRLTPESVTVLGDATDRLYSWEQPELPEDLSLIRFDGSPWLVTIAHERDSYLTLSPEEKAQLLIEIPDLRLSDDPIEWKTL